MQIPTGTARRYWRTMSASTACRHYRKTNAMPDEQRPRNKNPHADTRLRRRRASLAPASLTARHLARETRAVLGQSTRPERSRARSERGSSPAGSLTIAPKRTPRTGGKTAFLYHTCSRRIRFSPLDQNSMRPTAPGVDSVGGPSRNTNVIGFRQMGAPATILGGFGAGWDVARFFFFDGRTRYTTVAA